MSWTESVLWTIVSYLLTLILAFQVVAAKDRDVVNDRMAGERAETLRNLRELTAQEIEETLRPFLRAMTVQEKYGKIYRDHPALTTIAEAVLQRADEELSHILNSGKYSMRFATPIEEYVKRWFHLMERLDRKKYQGAMFSTMSNIVIWSLSYFGHAA